MGFDVEVDDALGSDGFRNEFGQIKEATTPRNVGKLRRISLTYPRKEGLLLRGMQSA